MVCGFGARVCGGIATYFRLKVMFEVAVGLAVMTGASAVLGLVAGCTLMVHETRLAVQSLAKEAEIWKNQTAGRAAPS